VLEGARSRSFWNSGERGYEAGRAGAAASVLAIRQQLLAVVYSASAARVFYSEQDQTDPEAEEDALTPDLVIPNT